jgi:hypothetical protein
MAHRVEDVRDSLAQAKEVNRLKGEAQKREDELNCNEYRSIEELGERALSLTSIAGGVTRETLIARIQSTLGRAHEIASEVGFVKPSIPNPSDWNSRHFQILSNPVLINDGAIALRLAFRGHRPHPFGQDFWSLLEKEGVEAAVKEFNGVNTPSVLAIDPVTKGMVANVALAPSNFSCKDTRIAERFGRTPFPFNGIVPLMSPYEQQRPTQPRYSDASHLSNDGLLLAAGLEARFSMHLDALVRGNQTEESY